MNSYHIQYFQSGSRHLHHQNSYSLPESVEVELVFHEFEYVKEFWKSILYLLLLIDLLSLYFLPLIDLLILFFGRLQSSHFK